METLTVIKKIGPLGNKDDKYYLFKSLLSNLTSYQTIRLLDLDFTQDRFKTKLILEKIHSDLETKVLKEHKDLFKTLLKKILELSDYYKNQRCAQFLFEISLYLNVPQRNALVDYFLSSKYQNNHKRACDLLLSRWDNNFSKLLVNSWKRFQNDYAIEVIVKKLPDTYLDTILDSLLPYFSEEEINYDFELKLLRNSLYARKAKKFKNEIEKLKKTDPISYIHIKKEAGHKIEKEFAIKIYKGNTRARRYLPRWFIEMGLLDVVNKIIGSEEYIS